jgi:hypothetical protein
MKSTKKLPPVSEISVLVLALVVAGGVYLAAHLPKHTSLLPTTLTVLIAGALVLANLFMLSRIANFAWDTFFLVAKWTLLAYAIFAGALEYIFIKDGTRGSLLLLMSATIVIFAINLPIHFGFTVARYVED